MLQKITSVVPLQYCWLKKEDNPYLLFWDKQSLFQKACFFGGGDGVGVKQESSAFRLWCSDSPRRVASPYFAPKPTHAESCLDIFCFLFHVLRAFQNKSFAGLFDLISLASYFTLGIYCKKQGAFPKYLALLGLEGVLLKKKKKSFLLKHANTVIFKELLLRGAFCIF